MEGMPHKLLLADDSVTIQRVIELTFADEDVTVVAVGNGQAAIDSVQRDRPDIVLADVGMPEKNGYEVAAFIKSNPALAGLTIPKTGSPRNVGIMVTKTLLFAGDGTDPMLDAYDKKTGEVLAQLPMPGMQTGLPMTYVLNGRQFILVSVGSANGQGPQLVAFAIPAAAPAGGGGRGGRGGGGAAAPGARGGAAAPATPGAAPAAPPAGGRGQRGARGQQ